MPDKKRDDTVDVGAVDSHVVRHDGFPSECPESSTLVEFVSQLLDPPAEAAVEQHLERCGACRDVLVALARSGDDLFERPAAPLPDEPAPASEQIAVGDRVDHFEIIELIGQGAMSRVFLARDTLLGRRVALKLLRRPGEPELLELQLNEARLTARFNHPHIVAIHAAGTHDGSLYLALEHLTGQTLEQRLDDEGPLSLGELARTALAIAQALKESHQHGVIHRDLKPANVMLTPEGRIVVLDFGLAKPIGSERRKDPAERPISGTPAYMAPEQWQGRNTPASDIWALGTILFEMVASERPYRHTTTDALRDAVTAADPAPALQPQKRCPSELAELVASCLRKKSDRRPTADEVVARLEVLVELAATRSHGPAEAQPPFCGLRPLGEEEHGLFFGRQAEVEELVERLRREATIFVVGPSGVGKSSLVRAGVLPRLRERAQLLALQLFPGRDPLGALAEVLAPFIDAITPLLDKADCPPVEALTRSIRRTPTLLNLMLQRIASSTGQQVVMFVDQLEELFTLAPVEQHAAFVDALAQAADHRATPVRLMATLREEYIGRLAISASARRVLRSLLVLGPPSTSNLRQMVLGPVRRAGCSYEDATIADRMVQDVGDEASALPLIQFAGQLLWRRRDRDRNLLTVEAFEEMGGVAGALAQHADRVLLALPEHEQQLARALLVRLVTPERTRRVLERQALLRSLPSAAEKVLDGLIAERLLTTRHTTRAAGSPSSATKSLLHLAHEALIETWGRLGRWVEQGRGQRAFIEDVGRAAELWRQRGERAAELWRDEALEEARVALRDNPDAASEATMRFIEASAQAQRRRVRIRRFGIVSGIATLALVALGASLAALTISREKRTAERLRELAERREARGLTESANAALQGGRRLEARAMLREALERTDSALGRALWRPLRRDPLLWQARFESAVYGVALSPSGELVAACSDRAIYLLDAHTRERRRVLRHAERPFAVAFSNRGDRIASGDWEGEVRLWRVADGALLRKIALHREIIRDLAFSPDDRLLAAASHDKTASLWDTTTGKLQARLTGHTAIVTSVDFSPDGSQLATASADRTVRLWNLSGSSTSLGRVLRGHSAAVFSARFSPDGSQLASGSVDRTIRLWNVADGETREELRGHRAPVNSVNYSSDGRLLVSASQDRTVRLWRPGEDQRTPAAVLEHHGASWMASFGSRDALIVSSSVNRTLRLWRVADALAARDLDAHTQKGPPHRGHVQAVAFSPDGRTVVSGGVDRVIRVWDARRATRRGQLRGHEATVWSLAFSPDGKLLASASEDRTVRLWDVESSTVRHVLRGHGGTAYTVSFSGDGKRLVSTCKDGKLRLWDTQSGLLVRVIVGHPQGEYRAQLSFDGRLLASVGSNDDARLFDVRSGRALRQIPHPHRLSAMALGGQRGELLLTGGFDGKLRLWPLAEDGRLSTPSVLVEAGRRIEAIAIARRGAGYRIGAGTVDGTLHLLDLVGGKPSAVRARRVHRGEITEVAMDVDGSRAATAGIDGTVRVVDATTGYPLWRAPLLMRDTLERAWQDVAAKRARIAVESSRGDRGCLYAIAPRGIELWDLGGRARRVQRLAFEDTDSLPELIVTDRGCLARVDGSAWLLEASGTRRVLAGTGGITALARCDDGQLFVARGRQLLTAASLREHPMAIGESNDRISALSCHRHQLLVGHEGGGIALFDRRSNLGARLDLHKSLRAAEIVRHRDEAARTSFERTPASPARRLCVGPGNTLVAGFADGSIGLWEANTGRLLESWWLHGPILQLKIAAGAQLIAATDLGDALVANLTALRLPYCELLRDVWQRVPVAWRDGHIVSLSPPAGHRCVLERRLGL